MTIPRFVPFAYGFRPFFLLAGWFALLGMGAWLWLYDFGGGWLAGLPISQWHGHEMMFGFIVAAIAGFMLTAVPSWTGTRGFGGLPLMLLASTWLAGRLAFAFSGLIPFAALVVIELAFLPAVAAFLAPPLLRSRNRNSLLLIVLLALWAADATFMLGLYRVDPTIAGAALRFALNLVLLLITVIGGRIVPAFTANALRLRGVAVRVRKIVGLERIVVAAMIVLVLVDAVWPASKSAGAIALTAGLAHGWRLAGWNGLKTLHDPIVWVLHLAYLWLPLGLLLKAAWLLGGFGWASFWMHALSAGAAASMILAVMSRAALGHTGRPLRVGPAIALSYVLLAIAAALRVFGVVWLPIGYRTTILVAGVVWMAAFVIFVTVYTPILLSSRVDSKPG